jgi:hypothetical protein
MGAKKFHLAVTIGDKKRERAVGFSKTSWKPGRQPDDRINDERPPATSHRQDFLIEIFLSQPAIKGFAIVDGLSPVDLYVGALAFVDCGLNPWTRTRFRT